MRQTLHSNHHPTACHASPAGAAGDQVAVHAHKHGVPVSDWRLAAQATVHCLVGCAIGEFAGLAIGVTLGLGPMPTMILATILELASGYTLGLFPLVRAGNTWVGAFKTIWLGETISILVMEIVMNFTDYHVGGVQVASILDSKFWMGFVLALPVGYLAALPVNYWLLTRKIKAHCH